MAKQLVKVQPTSTEVTVEINLPDSVLVNQSGGTPIIVEPPPPPPPPVNIAPIANAGSDITIKLPTNSIILNGSGNDPDGTIKTIVWTKVSGGAATIVNPNSLVTDLIDQISFNGGGTNFNEIFRNANKVYDRIIILSDMQGWMAERNTYNFEGGAPNKSFADYKKKYNCNPKIFSFDLNGHGTLQFPENNVYAIAGFSDKTLELMKLLETDRNALVSEIRKIVL